MAWKSKQALRVVDGFVAALNAHDADAAAQLLHPHMVFTDSLGDTITGREDCARALRRFVRLDDMLQLHIDRRSLRLPEVLLSGFMTARDPRFARKTLWRARVEDGMLAGWQSYSAGNPAPLARMLQRPAELRSQGSFASLLTGAD